MADLSKKQERFLVALLETETVRDACALSHTAERTAYRWLNDKDFDAAYRAARRQAVQRAVARLQRASATAAETLCAIAQSPNVSARERIAASRAILEFALRGLDVDTADILERLEALERERHAQL